MARNLFEEKPAESRNLFAENQVTEESDLLDQAAGGFSGAATLASDIVGTGVGGLTALVDLVNPFTDQDPEQLIDSVKQKLYIPPSEGGEIALKKLGDTLEPVAPIIKAVSEFTERGAQKGLDLTGSPAVATFIKLIPDLAAEMAGFGTAKRVATNSAEGSIVEQAQKTAMSEIEGLESSGIRQLTSDVIPPETRMGKFMQQQGELIEGSQRSAQQSERSSAVEKLMNKFGVEDAARYESEVIEGIKDSISKSKAQANEMFTQSTGELDKLGAVPLVNSKNFANTTIERELKKGALADANLIDDLQAISEAPDDMTFEMIKEIRSGIGRKIRNAESGAPVQGSTDVGRLKQVYSKLTNDMKSFADNANPELSKMWKEADSSYSDFATGANKQGVKNLIKQGNATPEVINQFLFSKKKSDLDFLVDNLDGRSLDSAKKRILQVAFDRSSPDGVEINPTRFLNQLNKLKPQTEILFSGPEREAINSVKEALNKTRRAQEANVATQTGQQLVPLFALTNPAVLVPGVLQAIIERPAIRNMLIKRKAAKSAKERLSIDNELQSMIDEAGLMGAATPAAISSQQDETTTK